VTARGLSFAVWTTPAVDGAPPLLCINGGLLHGHEVLWPALAPLSRHRQLVLYDQSGRGESQAPTSSVAPRIEHDAEDVRALREALGFRRWDVLGHSWGSGIAMLAAARDPHTRRLVLVAPVGATSEWLALIHERALARLTAAARAPLSRISMSDLDQPDPGRHAAYSLALYPAWFAQPDLAQTFKPQPARSTTGAAVAAALRRDGYNWRREVGAIGAASLVIQGVLDLVPTSVGHEVAALLPGARLELIPGCGHMPFWEAPESFFKLVDTFLNAPERDSPTT
jgi:proline iminopeptidase